MLVRWLILVAVACCLALPEAIRLGSLSEETPIGNDACRWDLFVDASPGGRNPLRDVTVQSGIDFQHVVGPVGTYFMPEVNGAGGAMFDYDGDGDLDIYLVNSGQSPRAATDFPATVRQENRMFRQDANGSFTDVTEQSGLGDRGYGGGCAIGDVDNDGDLDVYVTNYGADKLFENQNDGTFRDITDVAGIDNRSWGTCAAFLDYDRDGWLDLYVANYTADPTHGHSVACGYAADEVNYCGPRRFLPESDRLFHNEGVMATEDGRRVVKFSDVTKTSGIGGEAGAGFGVVCADLTGDGWIDIYVANDTHPNRLWINQRNGRFVNEARARGAATNGRGQIEAGMGVVLGDVDRDGDDDLISTHLTGETSTLYLNEGDGLFEDGTEASQLGAATKRHTGWGAALIDLDHDGDLDLAMANGLVIPCHLTFSPHGEESLYFPRETIADAAAYWDRFADGNQVFLNDGEGRFVDLSAKAGDFCRVRASARGLIQGDIDNDGDIDLLVTYVAGPARLFLNDVPKAGNWLTIRAVDPRLKRDAYGAVVSVATTVEVIRRRLHPASSYLASNDPRVHFGVGGALRYESIVVDWPDGMRERFPGGEANRFVTLQRGEGKEL